MVQGLPCRDLNLSAENQEAARQIFDFLLINLDIKKIQKGR